MKMGPPHILSGSIGSTQAPSGQDPSVGVGEGTQGRKLVLLVRLGPEKLCLPHAKGTVPMGMCQCRS